MRVIEKVTQNEYKELKLLMKKSDLSRVRIRAHAIILSSNGYSIEEISRIYEVDRDSLLESIDGKT